MSDLLTVVVPVFNTYKFLDRCMQSVVDQTYRNLEIIVVDDGSTDDSPGLCDKWEKQDNRIKVIHKSNGGLSSARNAALDCAAGEYISFLDSDDFWDPRFAEKMISVIKENNVQIVQCRLRNVPENFQITNHTETAYTKCKKVTSREALLGRDYNVTACAKIYHRSLFEHTRFPVGIIDEDEATYYQLAYMTPFVCMLDDGLYYYVQRVNSITHSQSKNIKMDFIRVSQERIQFFQTTKDPDLIQMAYVRYALMIILNHIHCQKNGIHKETQNMLHRLFRENKRHISVRQLSARNRVLFALYAVFPGLTTKMLAFLRR